jgi:hypothetical protein
MAGEAKKAGFGCGLWERIATSGIVEVWGWLNVEPDSAAGGVS